MSFLQILAPEMHDRTPVMNDLKAIVGEKDYFVVTSNGEGHFELCGFDPTKIYEIEGNWLTMQCARPCHDAPLSKFGGGRKIIGC